VRALALVAILLLFLCVVLFVAGRRARAAKRAAEADDAASKWERVRDQIGKALKSHQGATVILITGFRVPSQAAGHALRQSLEERWSDRVEVTWEGDPPVQPHWAVVTTTETVLVTPILERQWLARMRAICETYDCGISFIEVLWGGSPPTLAPLTPDSV
jgi:cbb3-type cytochrome oxidase subunit 3